ncbi:hypothetical protein RclHR1_01720024 [Rhizophagus clarus]|uniref:HMG box domain-containing protein n=1 Tax=Rhizophagus clarus TaxID=94130 RepID=A0A2Z6QJM6_9GLOM|nr:hypothetical protein RclHR1_01720024 [Rhizophagus clarus]GES99585.1 hypothetical protein GLOIN_2v1486401 [Rhizophagus clarus]
MTSINENLDLNHFRPSFPPKFKIDDFIHIDDLRNNNRAPNAFFVYRKIYTRHLLQLNCRFPMTQVSKLAAAHWGSESRKVKKYYRKIAKDVDRELDQRRQSMPRHSFPFNITTPSDIASNYGPKPKVCKQPSPIIEYPPSPSESYDKVIVINPNLTLAPPPIDPIEIYSFYNSESESDSSNDPPSNVLNECFDEPNFDFFTNFNSW